jgi:transcriptional regulator with XRE-family HTH domain
MVVVTDPTLAEWLDRRLTRGRHTQNAVAVYCGVSHSAVSAWRSGDRIPDPKYCWKLAEFFKEELTDVMRYAGHLPAQSGPLREERFQYDEEVLSALRRLTPEEQHAAALPAIELAEALLKRGRREAEE